MRSKLIIALLLIAATMQAQWTRPVLLEDDCEATNKPIFSGGYPPASWGAKQGDASNQWVRSTEASRNGSASYKVTVNNNAVSGYFYCKSELVWNFLPAGSPLGTVGDYTAYYRQNLGLRWVRMSIMIPETNLDYNTPTSYGFNTKSVEDDWGSGTSFSLQTYQGRWRVLAAAVTKSGTSYSWAWAKGGAFDVGPVRKGQWDDWVLNRNFTSDAATGYMRLYRNDTLVYEHLGGNWYDDGNHSREPYQQVGIYKWAFDGYSPAPDVSSVTAYFDDIAMFDSTATWEDVDITPATSTNQSPVITLQSTASTTATTIEVVATSIDADGTISGRTWARESGPNTPTQTATVTDTLRLSGLINGTYVYSYIVTDNAGAADTAYVTITKTEPPAAAVIIYQNNAEADPVYGTDQTQYFNTRSGVTTNKLERSLSVHRQGSYSYLFTMVNQATTGWQYTDNEVVWNYPPPIGVKWAAFSLYTPSLNQGDATATTVGFNFLRYTSVDPKPNYLNHENDSAVFYLQTYNAGGTALGFTRVPIAPVAFDAWTDWVLERNYTLSADTGYVRLYRNGVEVYEYLGPNYNPAGAAVEPYQHYGIWKPAYDGSGNNKDSVAFYYDEFRFGGHGATLADVSPTTAPVINVDAITSISTASHNMLLTATDPDGTISSLTVTQVTGPNTATASIVGDSLQLSGLINGTYTFTATATDNLQANTSRTFTVTRGTSAPPIISAAHNTFYRGTDNITISLTASDPDADSITHFFYQESGSSVTITNGTTNTVTLSGFRYSGNYSFVAGVRDANGLETSVTVYVTWRRNPVVGFNWNGQLRIILK